MAQSSGPISQGTTAERQFSDVLWRDLFGDEPGVISDMDGTAYKVTLPSSGDVVSIGSTSQASLARVAGFVHKIAAGSTEPITIPAATGSARADIISLRYDPAYTGLPGPVRLFRIAGTGTTIPTYDASPPGVEDLPLYAITRSPSQALSAATVQRLFPRLAPQMELPTGVALPTSSPLGTMIRQGSTTYRRTLSTGGVPVWTSDTPEVVAPTVATKAGNATATTNSTGYFTVTHGLTRVPAFVGVTSRKVGTSDSQTFVVSAKTSTTFTARAYWTNQPNVNVAVDVDWLVYG